MPEGHEQSAKICVAETELTEATAVLTDLRCRVIGVADDDLLGGEEALNRGLVALDIELVVVVEQLQQVDAGEVAGGVIDVHVFAARVGSVDARRVGRGVPTVDGGVVLHPRVGTFPGGLGELPHEVACLDGLHYVAGGDRPEVPVGVVDDGLHELVGDPHRIVGVLVLDRDRVFSVEVHVEAGIAKHAGLALLDHLAPDEVFDIGMVGVENDHLGGSAGLTAGLDRAGRRISSAHEADRPRSGAAAVEDFLRRADLRQVDTGPGAALEDDAFFAVPVEDRVHLVVDFQNEARRTLLRHALHTDVEPHR